MRLGIRLCCMAAGKPTSYEFEENGLLIGVRSNEAYSNVRIDLEPGDHILMYTDGIVEAGNESEEFFGEKRLKETIAVNQHVSPDSFATVLLQEVDGWRRSNGGSAQADDITVVIIDVSEDASSKGIDFVVRNDDK